MFKMFKSIGKKTKYLPSLKHTLENLPIFHNHNHNAFLVFNADGITEDITGSCYIEGNIYFFRQNNYSKFNEFSRKVMEAGVFNWRIFNLEWLVESTRTAFG